MKKVKYSFISFLLVVVCVTINAQMYTRTANRTYAFPATPQDANIIGLSTDPFTVKSTLKQGGTSGVWYGFTELQLESRGVNLYNDTWTIDDYPDNPDIGSRPDANTVGFLDYNYMDLSNETENIEIVAGEDFTVKSSVNYFWFNAVAFVDWDGNGAFDDHDPLLYNKYGMATYALIEYSGASITNNFTPDWTFTAPNVSEERKVRIRLRTDGGVLENNFQRKRTINGFNGNLLGIPQCSYAQEKISGDPNCQNFFSMCMHRFFPTAEGFKGTTLDFTITIKPNPYATTTPQPKETIAGAGNVAATCQTSQGTAISDAAGFLAFMNATSGDYYLANDITLTSVPVSQTTFSGSFDGNGHTITFSAAASATISGKSKDECFYPYGNDDRGIADNLFIEKQPGGLYPAVDMTNYPERAISGGFCGVLARGGVIKNVKVVYNADATYSNTSGVAPIFGLVAGINKGHIENVSIDIPAGKTVKLQNSGNPTASAFGGITGLLFRGVVKHCAVNIDGTMSHDAASAMQETLTSAFIGRLQVGIVSNVKFSGSGTMYANSSSVNYVRNYMGGIAGMTNIPKGEFCGDEDFDRQLKSWGYDNGTRGLDVNNVILSYSGAMNMANAGNNGSYAYNCRGLLFAEAYDTITVPNLVTQYAAAPTIEMEAPAAASLSGANIPLISKTKGIYNAMVAFCTGVQDVNNTPRLMGKVYLYKDGRFKDSSANGDKFTNVNVADAEVDWAYEYDPNTCSYYSTPYAVATYIGTNANIQGIEAASANVSDLGSAVVKIDPQPETVAAPSWTWSETASPATPNTDSPVCGGGGGVILPMASACTYSGNITNGSRRLESFTITDGANSVSVSGVQPNLTSPIYVDKTTSVLTSTAGATLSFSALNWIGEWMHGYVFIDYNNDGTFDQALNANGANSGELVSYNFYSAGGAASGQNSKGQAMSNNCGVKVTNMPSWTLPADLPNGIYRLRFMVAWNSTNPCGYADIGANGGCICDVELNIGGVTPTPSDPALTRPATLSCTISGNVTRTDRYLTSLTFSGNQGASLSSGTIQQGRTSEKLYHDFRTKSLVVKPGETITTSAVVGAGSWMLGYIYVDWNNDGDFSDSGEYMAGRTSANNSTPWWTPPAFTIPNDVTPGATYTMRYTGDWNLTNDVDRGADHSCGRTATTVSDGAQNYTAVNGGCMVDFELKIEGTLPTPPAAGGDGCAYVANFGNVFAGEVATYDIKLGAGSGATIHPEIPDDEYTLNYNDATGILTVTYNVPATPGAVAVDSIGGITKGGVVYRIAVSATVKAAPTVTFRMSDEGGGALSLDMGKTTFIEPRTLAPYKGDLLTAVPVGPTHLVGWYVSTDGGTTFNAVGHTNPDYTYTGTDDAIVEARFDFDDFEGDFGLARFTDNTNPPFYISSVKATGGIVSIVGANGTDPVTMFADSVKGGEVRWMYKEDARLQTLDPVLKPMTHDVTVSLKNGTTIPADARLLCFIDYNMNNYFDFTSSPDGLASALTANNELVYVGTPNGNADQTFTFTISNAAVTKFGKTRMRFMVATYVDMYGLGPVNQYGNYQPRIDTDGDGFADQELPLNDNNGSLYTPNNQCRYENYVNVADVTFEVVAYVRYNKKYTIKNGESVRMKNLYIEAQEDANGFHAGQIVFDKNAPYGSLIVEGNIILRRRIYPDKWHDVAFPIEMQGVGGKDGICAVGANGTLAKLPTTGKHLVYEFDPAGRNQTGGYGGGTKASADATFLQNKFYEFAADVPDGFTANDAGVDIDGVNSYWIQFHSVDTGFTITPSAAKTAILSYTRDEDAAEYWNRNVFTIYNPFLSNINVNEITASLGWEHITWWNAVQGRYTGVSAAETRDMPPYFGYWIQFTEGIGSGTPVEIVLGDANRADYPYADDRIVNFVSKMAPRRSALSAEEFDTPDSYTLGIDAAEDVLNETAASTTIVTLTDAGAIDEFRAGYDMPASLMSSSSAVPEIWSQAGSSAMMFNDVQRAEEVVVPVSIRIKESGEYALRLTHTNDSTSQVQVYDKETGATIDLQNDGETSTYSFLADEGDSNRFDLIISKAPKMVTDLEFVETLQGEQGAQVFVRGETLYLKNISEGYCVSICDVIGREYVKVPITGSEVSLPLPGMRGVYVVNILDKQNNSVQSVKVTK